MNVLDLPKEILDKIKSHELYSPEKKIVISRGSETPEIMFIGEAPGQEENRQGLPFVGRSGKLVNKWVEENNIENYIITNIVPLIPLNAEGGIRKPTKKEIEYFRFFIEYMLAKYKPKIVICLGATATEGFMNKKISESVFKEFDIDGIKVTAIYHPAFYLRRGQNGLEDFQKILKIFNSSSE